MGLVGKLIVATCRVVAVNTNASLPSLNVLVWNEKSPKQIKLCYVQETNHQDQVQSAIQITNGHVRYTTYALPTLVVSHLDRLQLQLIDRTLYTLLVDQDATQGAEVSPLHEE